MDAKSFKDRIEQLQKYVPVCTYFIDKIHDDPSKEVHLKSVKRMRDLLLENKVTKDNIDKYEDLLMKLNRKYEKEIKEQQFRNRLDVMQERYLPFLENCIRKLEATNVIGSKDKQLKTVRYLHQILQSKSLTYDNIDICEHRLKQLDEKVEQNTLQKIKQKMEVDHKKESKPDQPKCIDVPDIDGIVVDHTNMEKRVHTELFASGKDPRHSSKTYIERFKTSEKCVLLTVITSYSYDLPSRRNDSKSKFDHKLQKTEMLPCDSRKIAQVPKPTENLPPSISLYDQQMLDAQATPQITQTSPSIHPTPSTSLAQPIGVPFYTGSQSNDPLVGYYMMDEGNNYRQANTVIPTTTQAPKLSSADPRLRNRSQSSVYEATSSVVPTPVIPQTPYNSFGTDYQKPQTSYQDPRSTAFKNSQGSSIYQSFNKSSNDRGYKEPQMSTGRNWTGNENNIKRPVNSNGREQANMDYSKRPREEFKKREKESENWKSDRSGQNQAGRDQNKNHFERRSSPYSSSAKNPYGKKYKNDDGRPKSTGYQDFKKPKSSKSPDDDRNRFNNKRKDFHTSKDDFMKKNYSNKAPVNTPDDDELWEEDELPPKVPKLDNNNSLVEASIKKDFTKQTELPEAKPMSSNPNKPDKRGKSTSKNVEYQSSESVFSKMSSKHKKQREETPKKDIDGENLLLALSKMYGEDKLEQIKSILSEPETTQLQETASTSAASKQKSKECSQKSNQHKNDKQSLSRSFDKKKKDSKIAKKLEEQRRSSNKKVVRDDKTNSEKQTSRNTGSQKTLKDETIKKSRKSTADDKFNSKMEKPAKRLKVVKVVEKQKPVTTDTPDATNMMDVQIAESKHMIEAESVVAFKSEPIENSLESTETNTLQATSVYQDNQSNQDNIKVPLESFHITDHQYTLFHKQQIDDLTPKLKEQQPNESIIHSVIKQEIIDPAVNIVGACQSTKFVEKTETERSAMKRPAEISEDDFKTNSELQTPGETHVEKKIKQSVDCPVIISAIKEEPYETEESVRSTTIHEEFSEESKTSLKKPNLHQSAKKTKKINSEGQIPEIIEVQQPPISEVVGPEVAIKSMKKATSVVKSANAESGTATEQIQVSARIDENIKLEIPDTSLSIEAEDEVKNPINIADNLKEESTTKCSLSTEVVTEIKRKEITTRRIPKKGKKLQDEISEESKSDLTLISSTDEDKSPSLIIGEEPKDAVCSRRTPRKPTRKIKKNFPLEEESIAVETGNLIQPSLDVSTTEESSIETIPKKQKKAAPKRAARNIKQTNLENVENKQEETQTRDNSKPILTVSTDEDKDLPSTINQQREKSHPKRARGAKKVPKTNTRDNEEQSNLTQISPTDETSKMASENSINESVDVSEPTTKEKGKRNTRTAKKSTGTRSKTCPKPKAKITESTSTEEEFNNSGTTNDDTSEKLNAAEFVKPSVPAAEPVKKPSPKKTSPNTNKKKKSEVEKLNEDIDNCFIRDAVLQVQATGRRRSTRNAKDHA